MTYQIPDIDAYYKKFIGINQHCIVKDPLSVVANMISQAPKNKKKQLEKIVMNVVSGHMDEIGAPKKNDYIIISRITNDLDVIFKSWCSRELLKIWEAGKTAELPKNEAAAVERPASPVVDDESTDEEALRFIQREDEEETRAASISPPRQNTKMITVKRAKLEEKPPKADEKEKEKKLRPPVAQVPIAGMTNTDVRDFLLETYDVEKGKRVSAMSMYTAYCSWCGKSKEPISTVKFADAMREISQIHEKKKAGQGGKMHYFNLVLKNDAPAPATEIKTE